MNIKKNNVKKLRLEHKLKQEDIGEIISKSQQSVSRLEKEKREIDIYELCVLADYFNVSTDYILGRTENKITPNIASAYEALLIKNYSVLKDLRNLSIDEQAIITSIIADCVNLLKLNKKSYTIKLCIKIML